MLYPTLLHVAMLTATAAVAAAAPRTTAVAARARAASDTTGTRPATDINTASAAVHAVPVVLQLPSVISSDMVLQRANKAGTSPTQSPPPLPRARRRGAGPRARGSVSGTRTAVTYATWHCSWQTLRSFACHPQASPRCSGGGPTPPSSA